jgi:2EXR family
MVPDMNRLFLPQGVGSANVAALAKEANATKNAAKEFSLFTQLPPEIQNLIWKSAIDSIGSRVVEIRTCYYRNEFTSSCPIPNVLHACRASRQLALKRWKPSLAMKEGPARILFDSSRDILFFECHCTRLIDFVYHVRPADRLELRHVAFNPAQQYDNDYFDDGEDLAINIHRHFPAVASVVLAWRSEVYPGGLAKPSDPKKTVIEFFRARSRQVYVQVYEGMVREFKDTYALRGWSCPQIEHKDYWRSYPNSLVVLDPEMMVEYNL